MTQHVLQHWRRLRAAATLVALLLVGGAAPVFAADVIGTAVIGGGALTMVAVTGPTFGAILDGDVDGASGSGIDDPSALRETGGQSLGRPGKRRERLFHGGDGADLPIGKSSENPGIVPAIQAA